MEVRNLTGFPVTPSPPFCPSAPGLPCGWGQHTHSEQVCNHSREHTGTNHWESDRSINWFPSVRWFLTGNPGFPTSPLDPGRLLSLPDSPCRPEHTHTHIYKLIQFVWMNLSLSTWSSLVSNVLVSPAINKVSDSWGCPIKTITVNKAKHPGSPCIFSPHLT